MRGVLAVWWPHSLQFRILASVLAGTGLLVGSLGYLLLRANQDNTRYVLQERVALAHAVQRAVDGEVQAALRAVERLAREAHPSRLPGRLPSELPLDGLMAVAPGVAVPRVFAVSRAPGELDILVTARTPEGAVVGRVARDRLARLLAPPLDRHGYFVQVVGPEGWLAVRREGNAGTHAALCRPLLVQGHGGVVYHPSGPPDGDHYVTCVPLRTLVGYGVALERSPDGVVLLRGELQRVVFLVGAVLLVGAAAAAWLDVRRVLRPLSRLAAEAERMREGDLQTPVRMPPADAELAEVARAMEQMRAALCASLEEIRRRESHLQAVHEVATEVLRTRESRRVLDLIVQRARSLLDADVSVLCTLEAGTVRPVAWAGPYPPDARPLPGCPPETCPVLPDAYRGARWAAPVQDGSKVLGWLCVAYREPRTPGPEERRLLRSLAVLAAVALENLRLRGELRWLGILEERERLARELHDGLAQALGIIRAFATAGQQGMAPDRALQRVAQVAARAYEEVRQAIYGLRLSCKAGFLSALQEYVREFTRQTGVPVEVEAEGDPPDTLSPEVEVQLVRIVQEALTNVWRHARATRAVVRIRGAPSHLEVAVQDDGVGFDLRQVERRNHFGLLGMRERAAGVGAQLVIESRPGAGTRVCVRLPTPELRKVVGWTGSA